MLDCINIFVYNSFMVKQQARGKMKQSEFVRWLTAQGATFKDGKKHLKVYLNGKQTHLPRHPSAELKTGLVEGVKKQLGLK